MAIFELKLPKMGESVAEATITSWLKEIGDTIEEDDSILEIATDKVDSEIPSEVNGILKEKLFEVDDVIQVGQTIAIIETDTNETSETVNSNIEILEQKEVLKSVEEVAKIVVSAQETVASVTSNGNRFYSPLVKNIAKKEGISQTELDVILGTGKEGRVTKSDIISYVKNKVDTSSNKNVAPAKVETSNFNGEINQVIPVVSDGEDEIIEMTRMGKIVAKHMVKSVQTSAHVQSFLEVDVTKVWNWRNKVKDGFKNREGEKLTFTPIFMEAVAKALRDYPMMNISVVGDTIIKKRNINLGMATALEDGNLIVPVIKNADQLNLVGIIKKVNDLAKRARSGKLKPDDVQVSTHHEHLAAPDPRSRSWHNRGRKPSSRLQY